MPKRSRLMTSRKRQILRRMLTSEKKFFNHLRTDTDRKFFIRASLVGKPLKKGYSTTYYPSSMQFMISKDGKTVYDSETMMGLPDSKVMDIIEGVVDLSKAKVVSYA